MTTPLPEEIELYRDRLWRREPQLRVEHVRAAEHFVESVGFCSTLTDARKPGPSLYIAVCGRRDSHTPRNVQKDPETSLAWTIKDELLRGGRVYYGKLVRGRSTLVARRLISCFHTLLGIPRKDEVSLLSEDARALLKTLRCEWELATCDLRQMSGVRERARFNKALDELQRTLKVIPGDVTYEPSFTYIWSLAETRFSEEFHRRVSRHQALTEIARAYLTGAGMTVRGELARVTGLSAPDAGLVNWSLVDEEFAERLGPGVYRLKELGRRPLTIRV